MSTNLSEKTIAELSELLRTKKINSREITEQFIAEIKDKDKNISAFITKTFDEAREMANASDSRYNENKPLSEIDGIPITLKDVVCTKNIRTTAASNALKDFVPPYDGTVWRKLKKAGAVLLGKVNTDEFTMGSSTETSAFGVTKNPHDFSRVSGGSSGGSAAAVASNMCAGSIGTDTGGSIRQPANFCGCTGLKVSYGRVSRFGTIPMASSLDTVGPLAKSVEDCAMLLNIIAGQDENDSTTTERTEENFRENLKESLSGKRIGLPKEYFIDGIDQDVLNIVNSAKEILESLGAELVEVSLPHTEYTLPVYYIIAPSEISANMARYDGIRFGSTAGGKDLQEIYKNTRENFLGDEVKRRIILGTFALSAGYADAYYKKAQRVRTLIRQDFDKAFEKVDALLTPTSPTPAFRIGQNTNDPVKMYLEDIFTIPASLAGICGLSVPIGFSREKLPIGVQLLGGFNQETKILNIGHQLQKAIS